MKTNNIVKLVAEGVTTESGLELVVDTASSSYLSLSNQTITGPETSFTITGNADSKNAGLAGAKIILRKKNTTEALATLHVHVLPLRTVFFDVFYAWDDRISTSIISPDTMPAAAIGNKLNEIYGSQANINFTLRKTANLSKCYGGIANDGNSYVDYYAVQTAKYSNLWSIQPQVSVILEKGGQSDPTSNVHKIFVVKHLVKREYDAAFAETITNAIGTTWRTFSILNVNARMNTSAHEVGHGLGLSTKAQGNQDSHDLGPWPLQIQGGVADIPKQPGLMAESNGGNWLRQEDWKKANEIAGSDAYK